MQTKHQSLPQLLSTLLLALLANTPCLTANAQQAIEEKESRMWQMNAASSGANGRPPGVGIVPSSATPPAGQGYVGKRPSSPFSSGYYSQTLAPSAPTTTAEIQWAYPQSYSNSGYAVAPSTTFSSSFDSYKPETTTTNYGAYEGQAQSGPPPGSYSHSSGSDCPSMPIQQPVYNDEWGSKSFQSTRKQVNETGKQQVARRKRDSKEQPHKVIGETSIK